MDRLGHYDINTHQQLELESETGISEFNELNHVVKQLSDRTHEAYINQKQFVENASHEIQTPLAIIRSKVELLMEQQELSIESAELIMDIGDANNRLSKLNQTLILLSKIQNKQFIERAEVNLSELISKNLENLSQYYLENMPLCELYIKQHIVLNANPELLDILCNNLLRNAVIHNIPSGYIKIQLTANHLIIENTGRPLTIDPQLLFERFQTGDDKTKKTTGIGLAIVKQICDLHGYKINYIYHNQIHKLSITFP
jgi:signal transduction histidine kinase